eukprot:CAMPEP_0202349704 /NCGR_PEP_ID=MMETSP1126-20121109/7085_1 /ASSEMBLY_ACC=CAM_ASM_000457 /TAXON_ID=3047 /ORGANISM="Dunaliella tertiolecta, Strain CCMP1320" /LENGTH=553 /DNA_ID=CAMNT_0048941559 /DNA_START=58 /DNA_END=1716 /DNA_ORIENTATION=+
MAQGIPSAMRSPMMHQTLRNATVLPRCLHKTGSHRPAVRSWAAAAEADASPITQATGQQVRVRFAPSPTGNLHVGGARTALFNWLFAKHNGGKFILRIEDTDKARSTLESEEMVLRDLKWLGLSWDEGPDVGGPHGPYRQSERTAIYKEYVDKLVEAGVAYPCFCTDEELDAMKKEAEEKKLPPIYRGKWATASKEEVEAMKATGAPFCYRFRVPKNKEITIKDTIRGDVTWNTDTLGDFVLLRSNGLPVYNFCVAIDDCLMQISHVIRAEEHLPNTLRQVLIYDALGFPRPVFSHVSLILAPDKSKLSKRHGATSVGEFANQGYLAPAMINFLSLLGWNDGTEQEIYQPDEIASKFSLDRITKSAAVFDKTKLSWMNGQHIKMLPEEQLKSLVEESLLASKTVGKKGTPFMEMAVKMAARDLEVLSEAPKELCTLLEYPLEQTLASPEAQPFLEDNMKEIVEAVLAAHDSGELKAAISTGHDGFKAWLNTVGKAQKRKGKRLFMPMRIVFTGRMQGPEVGEQLQLLALEDGDVCEGVQYTSLPARMEALRAW